MNEEEKYKIEQYDKYFKEMEDTIEKQQKEIEKLKRRKYILNTETNELKEIPIDGNYISKDKIKEKIKELEQIKNTALTERTIEMMEDKINILNLLLEE